MTNEEIIKQLNYLIGSRYVASVKAYIGELTGRRVVGPGEVSTHELDMQRMHISSHADGTINGFHFG